MAVTNQVDKSRMMGTAAFKKEINHLLYSNSHTGTDGEIDQGWNSRDHALVMALMLKSGDIYPRIATGKCMFVQGPVAGNAAFAIGQESHYNSGHNWLVHSKFGLIDVSPSLQTKEHRFREPFNGIFNRVWLPSGKERVSVVLCHNPPDYEHEIEKARHAMSHSTAVYLHLDDQEVTEKLIASPFKFLNSRFSAEIKSRFGAVFYPAVAKHLHDFVLGKKESLVSLARLKAWGTVVDDFSG
ncbi:MAG TPA: hypothetical protein VIS57_00305 [Xanthomonadales bacterium]